MKRIKVVLKAVFLVVLVSSIVFGIFFWCIKKATDKLADELGITAQLTQNSEDKGKAENGDGDSQISINVTGNNFVNARNTEVYCDSMQEALQVSIISLELEEEYMRNMDEVIKVFENDQYALVYYRAVKDKKEEAYNLARFIVRIENGQKQYDFEWMSKSIMSYNSIFMCSSSEIIRNGIVGSEIIGNIGIEPQERFIYGHACEDFFEEGESMDYFMIEGQKPDEIIEYESFGRTWYFWYFNDLQSDKKNDELEFTLKEE